MYTSEKVWTGYPSLSMPFLLIVALHANAAKKPVSIKSTPVWVAACLVPSSCGRHAPAHRTQPPRMTRLPVPHIVRPLICRQIDRGKTCSP